MMDFISSISSQTLYIIGLVLVILYLSIGIDDFVWDIISLFRRLRYRKQLLDLHEIDSVPPKLLAVVIAAWHEDNVIGDVIENVIASTHYPRSMYHIFIGVYPNDEPTVEAVRMLAEKYPNVHVVVNCEQGPTSKAQNLNYVIKQIKQYEQEKQWSFAAFNIHDSEDVIHPYELKVTNYLLDTHEAMQFPLFPLMKKPKLSNFFKSITACSYADEFAENHFMTMVGRYQSGAFVPSAGTGCTLSRKTIDSFGDEDVLPDGNLTEDYRLALTLFEKGIQLYYVLEKVPRINEEGKLIWDFIATRSRFPHTFKTAVKQKTRWILGITIQSFKLRDVFKIKGIRFVGRYSMYKDLKAKVGNLLVFLGYPVLAYVIASMFLPLKSIYPMYTLSWYMSVAVTIMMLERQVFRGVAVYNVYGMRSVFFSVLLPPLLPIRLIWGNLLNLAATLRAYQQSVFGIENNKINEKDTLAQKLKKILGKEKKYAWDKTHHYFIEKDALKRYHRKLGDVLMEKGYVSPEQLQVAMRSVSNNKQIIGSYFLEHGIITEGQLLTALSEIKHIRYFDILNIDDYNLRDFKPYFDGKLLETLLVAPLLKTDTGFVIAFCDNSPMDAQSILRNEYNITVHAVFASQETINRMLVRIYSSDAINERSHSPIIDLYSEGVINYEQVIIAYNYKNIINIPENEVLGFMGLLPGESFTSKKNICEELSYDNPLVTESGLQITI